MKLLHERQLVNFNLYIDNKLNKMIRLVMMYLFFKEAVLKCLLSRVGTCPSKYDRILLQQKNINDLLPLTNTAHDINGQLLYIAKLSICLAKPNLIRQYIINGSHWVYK